MHAAVIASVGCPFCHQSLSWTTEAANCGTCQRSFPIDGQFINFLDSTAMPPLTAHLEEHYRIKANNSSTPQTEREVLALIPRQRVATAIDIGCGNGSKALALTEQADLVICLDLASSALRLAQAKLAAAGRTNAIFVVADALHIPVQDAVCEIAVCTEVIEHVSTPEDLLQEIKRVVRPKGTLVLSTPNYANITGLFKLAIDKIVYSGATRWSPFGVEAFERHVTTFSTQASLRKTGWTIEQFRGADFWYSFRPILRVPLILIVNIWDKLGSQASRLFGLEYLIKFWPFRLFGLSQAYRLRKPE
jgi:ubiquinone/menaquinone biosynthesis C-methylase UbiE